MKLETKAALEPAALSVGDDNSVALISIAISLKRIADEFDGKPDRLGMSDMIYEISNKVNRG